MTFSLSAPWYFTLAQSIILLLAVLILLKIFKHSLWNLQKRTKEMMAVFHDKKHISASRHLAAVLFNLFFIWLLMQCGVLLMAGFFGISPKTLTELHFQQWSLLGVLALSITYIIIKR